MTKEQKKVYAASYYLKNRDKIRKNNARLYQENQEERREYASDYLKGHKEQALERNRKYRAKNKEKVTEYHKAYHKKWYSKNQEARRTQIAEYKDKRRKIDPLYRMRLNIRTRLCHIFRQMKIKKTVKTQELLGINYKKFTIYIESLFREGMCWDKMGTEIHIDHIIPLSSAKNEEELIRLCHYTNLQPLWASENLHKSNKLDFCITYV